MSEADDVFALPTKGRTRKSYVARSRYDYVVTRMSEAERRAEQLEQLLREVRSHFDEHFIKDRWLRDIRDRIDSSGLPEDRTMHTGPQLRFTAGADIRAGQLCTVDIQTGMLVPMEPHNSEKCARHGWCEDCGHCKTECECK